MARVKLTPLPKLVKKADRLFSRYIRDRDTVDGLYTQTEEGLSIPCGYCITCKKVTPTEGIQSGDAGHFIKRACWPLRYSVINVHLQDTRCNHFLGGNDGRYAVEINRLYGSGTAEKLHAIEDEWKRNGSKKFGRLELEEVIEKYGG